MGKRKRGDRGWNTLNWKSTQVEQGGLGDADDCFVFSIEELDGNDYVMERDAVGGLQVKSRRGGESDGKDEDDKQPPPQQHQDKKKQDKKKARKGKAGKGTEQDDDAEVEPMDIDVEEIEVEEVEGEAEGPGDDDEEDEEDDDMEEGKETKEGGSAAGTVAVSKKAQKRKERKERWKKARQEKKRQDKEAAEAGKQQQQEEELEQGEQGGLVVALPGWSPQALDGLSLHPLLLQNLARQGFQTPTPIQRLALPAVMTVKHQGKDLMGAAETGSGKTLAYGIPILDYLLKRRDTTTTNTTDKQANSPLQALVLCPTRELAMQVTTHLQEMLVGDTKTGREQIKVVSIVGGLSDQKQERLLGRRPQVVVATIGRLWELIMSNEPHLKDLALLRFLVLDEADRMVEDGHYPELDKLMGRLITQQKQYQQEYEKQRQKLKAAAKEGAKANNNKKVDKKSKKKAADEEDEEEDDEELADGLIVPPEVPTLTLDDIKREAREEEEETEELDEDDLKGIIIGGGVKEVEGEEEEDEEEENKGAAAAEEEEEEEEVNMAPPVLRQTLIFSATLAMDEDMREGGRKKKKKKPEPKGRKGQADGGIISKIMKQVGLRGRPAIIDLSRQKEEGGQEEEAGGAEGQSKGSSSTVAAAKEDKKGGSKGSSALALPAGLQLTYIKTVGGEKDVYLYYFLRQYPGRTIVFTNSIDQTKRVAHLLQILKLPARALHAKMQQRQRLKSLDSFKTQPSTIMVATDVAARGLDISLVEHVIHYDLPRSLEVFVHRSGRTARASREGLSFSLVGPRDDKMHNEVCKVLLQGAIMPTFPVDLAQVAGARDRVNLAGRIVGYEQEVERKKASQNWFLKSARDAELELDEELAREEEEGSNQDRQRTLQVIKDRERLADLLTQPLVIERRKFVDVASRLRLIEEQKNAEEDEEEEAAKEGGGGGSQQPSKNKAKAALLSSSNNKKKKAIK